MARKKTFEQALGELSEIVSRLEKGNLPLEESLKLYQEGVALTAACENELKNARLKIKEVQFEAPDGADGEE